MNLTILTPEQELFNGAVKSVKVPAIGGQFEILSRHAPVVAALEKGKVRVIDTKGETTMYSILDGYVEVLNNEVVILIGGVDK
jgi:F-type H+-transporting ATPase subunit epsilon